MSAIVILPLAAAIALKFHKRIEEAIAPAMCLVVAILYVSGLFASFHPGFFLALALVAVSLCYVIFWAIRNRAANESAGTKGTSAVSYRWQDGLWTPGLAAYLCYLLVFAGFNYNRHLTQGVDFLHWGIAVRDFLRLSDFSNAAGAADLLPMLPPGVTLWNWFGLSLWKGYSEGASLLSQEALQAAFALPLFTCIENRGGNRKGKRSPRFFAWDWKRWLILWFALLALPLAAGSNYAYSSLAPSFVQGFAAALLLWFCQRYRETNDRFYRLSLWVTAFFLGLAGPGGFLLGISVVIALAAMRLAGGRCAGKRASGREAGARDGADRTRFGEMEEWPFAAFLSTTAGMTAGLFAAMLSWCGYLAVSGAVNNPLVIRMWREALPLWNGPKGRLRLLFLVLNGLSEKNFSGSIGHVVPLSFFSFLLLVIIGFSVYYAYCRRKARTAPRRISALSVGTLLAAAAIWLICLNIIYLYALPTARADELAYLELMLIPAAVFLLYGAVALFLPVYGKRQTASGPFWLTLLWGSLLSVNLGALLFLVWEKPSAPEYPALQSAYEEGYAVAPGEGIFYMQCFDRDSEWGYTEYRDFVEQTEKEIGALYYTLTADVPVRINLAGQDLKLWRDNMRMDASVEEMDALIGGGGYAYAYIPPEENEIGSGYLRLFVDRETMEEGGLYKVNVYDGIVQLSSVSLTGEE